MVKSSNSKEWKKLMSSIDENTSDLELQRKVAEFAYGKEAAKEIVSAEQRIDSIYDDSAGASQVRRMESSDMGLGYGSEEYQSLAAEAGDAYQRQIDQEMAIRSRIDRKYPNYSDLESQARDYHKKRKEEEERKKLISEVKNTYFPAKIETTKGIKIFTEPYIKKEAKNMSSYELRELLKKGTGKKKPKGTKLI
jgi:hypothetical protein